MGLLPQNLDCDLPEGPAGCNALFQMGEAMLDQALAALEPFMSIEGCEDGLDGFVSLGPSNEAPFECNYLAVWLVDYGLSQGSASADARAAGRFTPILEAHWRIEIWEGSYPMMMGEEGPIPPSRDLLHAINRHMYAHGEAVYHGLINADLGGTLFDYAVACSRIRWGRLVPLPIQQDCGGWQFDAVGEVPDPGA